MSDTSGITPVSVTAGNDQADLQGAQTAANAILGKANGPVGYGAGQSPFAAAANNVDAQKAAMLAAIAQGGSAGRAALDQANANLQAQRQAAINTALSGAATRGAGAGLGAAAPGMQAAITQQVGQPGAAYSEDLGNSARDFTLTDNALANGYGQYADEAKAAVPVIEANTQQSLQSKRMDTMSKLAAAYSSDVAKAQNSADTAQQNQALKDLELKIAGVNLDKANSQATGDAATAAGREAAAGIDPNTGQPTGAQSYAALNKQYGPTIAKAAATLGYNGQDVSAMQGHDGGKSWPDLMTKIEQSANAGLTPAETMQRAQAYSQKTYGNSHPEAIQILISALYSDFAKAPAQPAQQ